MNFCDPFMANHSSTEVTNSSLIENFWSEWGEEEENIIGEFYQPTWSKDLYSITDEILQQYNFNWSDDKDAFEEAFKAQNDHIKNVVENLKKHSAEKEVKQTLKMYSQQVINDQSYEMLYMQQKHFEPYYYQRNRRYGGY